MPSRSILIVAGLLLGVAGGAWWLLGDRPPDDPRPSVVLLTVDTLRADRVGCYGSTTAATPHIDALAREGTLFEQAASPMPITRASHFTIFTSLYPRDHGVVHNGLSLPAGRTTLAEVFREGGYRTAAFVGVSLLDPPSGASRGFEVFDYPTTRRIRDAEAVITGATRWLDSDRATPPFFLWVHLFDPHQPYAPSAPFRPPARDDLQKSVPWVDWDVLMAAADRAGGDVSAEVFDRAIALYDGEVEYTDHWVGALLDALRSRHLLDRTVVAFTADHGECFERGIFFEHYNCLHDGATHVPLVLRYPSAVPAGVRDGRVVEHLDVAPTLLRLAGLAVPETFQGTPLFPPTEAPRKEYAFIERPLPPASRLEGRIERQERVRSVKGEPVLPTVYTDTQVGLRGSAWKYVVTGEREELYDLSSDPGEKRNVADTRPAVVARLRSALQDVLAKHPQPLNQQQEPLDESLRATLRALGYLP